MTTSVLFRRHVVLHYLLSFVALANIVLFCIVAANHLRFPLNLEAMETTVLEHVHRAMTGLPIYTEPTAGFAPLAYTPLYYYLCAFFAQFLGLGLTTLREVTLLGTAGSAVMLYLITVRETRSKWCGLMTLGLFAASYQALDCYYDVAHRDTWLLFLILAGCYLIGYSKSRLRDAVGMLLLVAGFWMKQQGSIFVAGGLGFLLWRDLHNQAKWYQSWLSLLTTLAFGPLLYILFPTQFAGEAFHYFTWSVPYRWTGLTTEEIRAFAELVATRFAVPAALAGAGLQLSLERGRPLGIWIFFLPIAFLSAVMATCTAGSNMNVFIPFAVWLMLSAVLTLPKLTRVLGQSYFPAIALTLAFLALVYDPTKVMVSERQANAAYVDLVQYLQHLDGPVYAPWVGQLPSGATLQTAAHWVPLEDIERGPHATRADAEFVRKILNPVLNPHVAKAYLLHNERLKTDPLLGYIADSYVLEQDLGNRFKALDCLPRRYTGFWPRYLYRYDPQAALRLSAARKRP